MARRQICYHEARGHSRTNPKSLLLFIVRNPSIKEQEETKAHHDLRRKSSGFANVERRQAGPSFLGYAETIEEMILPERLNFSACSTDSSF